MSTTLSPAALQTLLSQGCCLVDVREPVEHAEAHIAGSTLIPLAQIEQRAGEIARDQPLVVMCRGGVRGEQARAKLQALGFINVQNLEGGILAWQAAQLPIVKGARKCLPLMQQVQIVIGLGVLTGVVLSRLVHPDWVFLCAFFGAGMVFAGSTGWCGLAILLSKMPWNRVAGQACASGSCAG
jgi:rhodanese-related sulfurtransferase